eukprot:3170823-Pleurochrysis_carterae.AAC.1
MRQRFSDPRRHTRTCNTGSWVLRAPANLAVDAQAEGVGHNALLDLRSTRKKTGVVLAKKTNKHTYVTRKHDAAAGSRGVCLLGASRHTNERACRVCVGVNGARIATSERSADERGAAALGAAYSVRDRWRCAHGGVCVDGMCVDELVFWRFPHQRLEDGGVLWLAMRLARRGEAHDAVRLRWRAHPRLKKTLGAHAHDKRSLFFSVPLFPDSILPPNSLSLRIPSPSVLLPLPPDSGTFLPVQSNACIRCVQAEGRHRRKKVRARASACCDLKRPVSSVEQPNAKRSDAHRGSAPCPMWSTSCARYPEYDEPSWYETRYEQRSPWQARQCTASSHAISRNVDERVGSYRGFV